MTLSELMQKTSADTTDSSTRRCVVSNEDVVTYEVFTDEAATEAAVASGGDPLPLYAIRRYAYLAAAQAEGKMLEDGTCYLEVPALAGVWADGPTLKDAFDELREVVFEWVALKFQAGDEIPVIGGLDLNRA